MQVHAVIGVNRIHAPREKRLHGCERRRAVGRARLQDDADVLRLRLVRDEAAVDIHAGKSIARHHPHMKRLELLPQRAARLVEDKPRAQLLDRRVMHALRQIAVIIKGR
jgi:hypothetical protein